MKYNLYYIYFIENSIFNVKYYIYYAYFIENFT